VSLGGTITDEQGNFTFSFPAGETLQVTCIGYVTVESRFTRDSDWLVTMDEDAQMLEDVVVVGYGVQKKESVVGSISQVGAESLVNSGTTNITNALAGKLAGVLTFQSSGTPGGSDAEILVRGVSSWNGSSPLVMVDGVERSFNELDPNEVETISAFVVGYDKITLNDKERERFIELFNKSHFTGRPDGEHGTADGTVEVNLKNGSSISVSVFECGCNPEVRLYNSDGRLEDYYTISNIDINPFVKSLFNNSSNEKD
jgi:hypothetical protein